MKGTSLRIAVDGDNRFIQINGHFKNVAAGDSPSSGTHRPGLQTRQQTASCRQTIWQLHRPQLRLLQKPAQDDQTRRPGPLRSHLPRTQNLPTSTPLPTQSQALRRELKSTLKRVQEEVKSKREEAFQSLSQEGVKGEAFGEWLREEEGGTEPRTARAAVSGSELIVQMMVRRQELLLLRGEKQKQSRFY